MVLTLAIGVLVSTVAGSAFASRYAAVFFPLFVLLVAGGITRFADRRLLAGAFSVVLALSLMGAYWTTTYQRTQGREAAHAINAAAEPGDLVVMCPDQLGPAYSRSLRDDVDVVTYPTMAPPQLVNWVDYGERNRASDPAAFAQRGGRPGPGPQDLPGLADHLQDLRAQVRGPARRAQRGPARVGHPGRRRRHEVLRARGRHRVPGRPVTETQEASAGSRPSTAVGRRPGGPAGVGGGPGAGGDRVRAGDGGLEPAAGDAPRAVRQRPAGLGRHLVPRPGHLGVPRRAERGGAVLPALPAPRSAARRPARRAHRHRPRPAGQRAVARRAGAAATPRAAREGRSGAGRPGRLVPGRVPVGVRAGDGLLRVADAGRGHRGVHRAQAAALVVGRRCWASLLP